MGVRQAPTSAVALALVTVAGCMADIGEGAWTDERAAGAPAGPRPPGGPGTTTTPPPPPPPGAALFAPVQSPRLTQRQFVNTIRDLLGDAAAAVAARVDLDDPIGLGDHRFRTMRAAVTGFDDLDIERLDGIAFEIARAVFEDAAGRARLVGCTPTTADGDCAKGFVARLGRLAYRRPLAPEEIARYAGVMAAVARNEGGDPWKGLEAALAALVQSPHLLYRVDVGERDPQAPGRLRYTGHEMAGRLALLLWDSAPDESLLAAADAGQLATPEGVRQQAERMLKSSRAARGVAAFASDMFEADRLPGLEKDRAAFPRFGPVLAAAMREEIERTAVDLVLAQDADLMDLFTTRATYVNEPLAQLYEIPGVKGLELRKVTLPAGSPRAGAGALGFAGFLAVNAGALEASPILRGVFLNERMLCREFGQPPAEAMNASVAPDASGTRRTLRQRVEATTRPPNCAPCHDRIDPLGFGLEPFDAIGAARATDNGLPIDASGTLDGVAFDGPASLARALRDNEAAARCLARQLYRFATGHHEDAGEEPVIQAVETRFLASGRRARQLFADFVASDAFRYARAASP